jgi:hypothetical protein
MVVLLTGLPGVAVPRHVVLERRQDHGPAPIRPSRELVQIVLGHCHRPRTVTLSSVLVSYHSYTQTQNCNTQLCPRKLSQLHTDTQLCPRKLSQLHTDPKLVSSLLLCIGFSWLFMLIMFSILGLFCFHYFLSFIS